jgi:hypothetical protein
VIGQRFQDSGSELSDIKLSREMELGTVTLTDC